MTGATLLVFVAHKQAGQRLAKVARKPENKAGATLTPTGLTRRRPAFIKAISMLADGAATNSNLAEYYRSVTTRVSGEGNSGDSNPSSAVTDAGGGLHLWNDLAIPVSRIACMLPGPGAGAPESNDPEPSEEPQPETPKGFTVGDLSFETNAAVEQWTSYYASTPIGRMTMRIGMERSNAYLEMARANFREAGVPEDLVWLAFVESVWNPRAASRAAACGLWQFIKPTATEYGLKVQGGSDERQDPEKQTRVAARYLHDLYTIFGDWALSLAAYNSGEPRVMGAIVKNGRADFWELYEKQLLPKETLNYVPKILASIKVAGQPEYYGLMARAEAASASST